MFIPIRDSNAPHHVPFVTYGLIAVNVLVHVGTGFGGQDLHNSVVSEFGFTPSRFSLITIFTSMFLHGSIMHLLGNMLFLWIFGDNVEDGLGRGVFLLAYLATGVAAALAQMVFGGSPDVPMIGASGAIAGVMGLYVVLYPKNDITFLFLYFYRFSTFELPAYFAIGFFFLKDVVMAMLQDGQGGGIAFSAHIGGMLAGAFAALAVTSLQPRIHRSERGVFSDPEEGNLWVPLRPEVAPEPRKRLDIADEMAFHPRSRDERRRIAEEDAMEPFESAYVVPAVSRPGSELKPQFDPVAAMERALHDHDDNVLAGVYMSAVRGGRRTQVSDRVLARVADRLAETGHETLSANAWRRLVRREKGTSGEADAHVQLAWLYSEPLFDAVRARYHLREARRIALTGEAERAAADIEDKLDERLVTTPEPWPATFLSLDMEAVPSRIVARTIARVTGVPALDVSWQVQNSMGVLAEGVSAATGPKLITALEDAAVPFAVFPDSDKRVLPEAQLLREAEVSPHELRVRLKGQAARVIPWSEVAAASAYWTTSERVRSSGNSGSAMWESAASLGRAMSSRVQPDMMIGGIGGGRHVGGFDFTLDRERTQRKRVEVQATAFLELLIESSGGLERIRFNEKWTLMRTMHGRSMNSSVQSMQLLAGAVLARDEGIHVSRGVAALAGIEDPDPHYCSGAGKVEAYLDCWWKRYLLARG